ncbi:MAG: hypothetical protein ACQEQI_06800 [Bacillota bacterium]
MQRDIELISLSSTELLVIGCDSLGGIGPKLKDQVQVSGQVVGQLTTRVSLFEVLAVRATPKAVINTLSVEYDPVGCEIIEGIESEISKLNLTDLELITGSTEENVPTIQTGLGVTVIGQAVKQDLQLAASQAGDVVVAIGLLLVGSEVLNSLTELVSLADLELLSSLDYIHDILPVGSKGIGYELRLLADINQLELTLVESSLDLDKSAGPATVILVTLEEEYLANLKAEFELPITIVGQLK